MFFTSLAYKHFSRRWQELALYLDKAAELQRSVLGRLISSAKNTEYGRRYGFEALGSYEAFAEKVPVVSYEEVKGDIDRMRRGEKDVLWHGQVKCYAKSSGTTADKSKFIPVSREGLRDLHFRGSSDVVALYLAQRTDSRIFDGKSFILGGSHVPNYDVEGSIVGDLSAILLENMHPIVRLFTTPSKDVALLADFEQKRERLAHELIHKDVTSLSGVPSWMLSVLLRTLEVSGRESLDELFPHLEVFFHGGISFAPYRPIYENIIRNPKMMYMETYNASEGFFGIQSSQSDPSLLLMVDYGVFYEFCPLEALDEAGRVMDVSRMVPLDKVEKNRNYAMIITTNCGLWRYVLGDTVRFTSTRPYKFVITGRTKSFINAFGEELIVDNANKGLAEASRATDAVVLEYTAAPVFMDKKGRCRHQWLIEFAKEPNDINAFAETLDSALRQINSDYEAKRFKSITLQRLEVVVARQGLFNDWLKTKGQLGAQHKVPRLSNNRNIIEELLELNQR